MDAQRHVGWRPWGLASFVLLVPSCCISRHVAVRPKQFLFLKQQKIFSSWGERPARRPASPLGPTVPHSEPTSPSATLAGEQRLSAGIMDGSGGFF